MVSSLILAIIIGVLQGIFEWIPISSEGSITLFLTTVVGVPPRAAVQFALFVQAGTILSVLVYYRNDLAEVLTRLPGWRPCTAFDSSNAELSFLAVATVMTGVVGIPTYVALQNVVGALASGGFVAVIGALLIVTGLVQRTSTGIGGTRSTPTLLDGVLVGGFQGLTILPGISRSGTTISVLLMRQHDGSSSLRLSFLLSIPATAGAGVLALAQGGLPALDPTSAVAALATSAIVGYISINVLMGLVERIEFWAVCIGLGAFAVFGGALVTVGIS